MTEAITRIIPILMMMILGIMIKHLGWADKETMDKLKKGIVNIALPAVLFLAFMKMELSKEYFAISAVFFILMNVLLFTGMLLNRIKRLHHPVLPFLMTGFAFGLLGIPLYGGVYGLENVGALSILGVGHEFFAWFIYFTVLKHQLGDEKFSRKTIEAFLKSPLIISIIAGIVLNVTGFAKIIDQVFLLKGMLLTLEMLGSVTTPLILVIVGYGIHFDRAYMKKSVELLILRLLVVLVIGYALKYFVINPYFGQVNGHFDMSYYTFLILPPPFALAIFTGQYSTEENTAMANNTIVLSTLLCVLAFCAGVVINSL